MKFYPYRLLLTTAALMLATVVFAQTGSSIALLKAGAASVDRDVSSLAAKTFASLESRALVARESRVAETRVASIDEAQGVIEKD